MVDDGSSDESGEIAAATHNKVTVIKQKNRGAAAARNRGIQESQAEWIAFLDSDDEWHPEKLEKQLHAADQFPDAGLIFTDTRTINQSETVLPSRFDLGGLRPGDRKSRQKYILCGRDYYKVMLEQSRVITSAVMARRSLRNLLFPEQIWGAEDWHLWLSLILDTDFVGVDEILVTMKQGKDNLTHHSNMGKLQRNVAKSAATLLGDPRLSSEEKQSTERFLSKKMTAAIYHSLRQRDFREARSLLTIGPRSTLSKFKAFSYYLWTFIGPLLPKYEPET